MTTKELAAIPGNYVGTKEAAAVMGCDRWTVSLLAKAGRLPYRYFFSGNRLKISKASILEDLGWRGEDEDEV